MPYIAIKAFPKDEQVKKDVVDKINQLFLETWGCPQEAITISVEDVAPTNWESQVRTPEILTKLDKMMILDGKKRY